MDWFDLKQTV